MYFTGIRPAEVTDLHEADCTLPEQGWFELVLAGSTPRVSSIWTDDGRSYEERGFKRRARKATRPVPIPPELLKLLREHIENVGVGPEGRVFRASLGGHLLSKEYSAVWKKARTQALSAKQAKTPFTEVPYTLRHAGVSLWPASGVDPVERWTAARGTASQCSTGSTPRSWTASATRPTRRSNRPSRKPGRVPRTSSSSAAPPICPNCRNLQKCSASRPQHP